MLDRARTGDADGNFRRVWLLTTLLEDYFIIRNRRYEGPKLAPKWLRDNDPDTYFRFEQALRPGSDLSALRAVVAAVTA
jgi:hypothetical protein